MNPKEIKTMHNLKRKLDKISIPVNGSPECTAVVRVLLFAQDAADEYCEKHPLPA